MNRRRHSGAFMMEMITVVFFFMICASVCILIFVKADTISRKARDLNRGVMIAQSVAEVWKAGGIEDLQRQFGAEDMGNKTYVYEMGFDEAGRACQGKEAVYQAVLSLPEEEETDETHVTVSRSGDLVYQLQVWRKGRLE